MTIVCVGRLEEGLSFRLAGMEGTPGSAAVQEAAAGKAPIGQHREREVPPRLGLGNPGTASSAVLYLWPRLAAEGC